ncbi:MAG: hypothetical protein LBQ83_03400 [Candidatus Margulisbacteria bacterium]|jgi:hypothetical protein|nr:hypothetical protein [Candidatus Margulisiibacteriota bacterium]
MVIETGQPLLASDINNLTFFPKGTILTYTTAAWNSASAAFKQIWYICNGQPVGNEYTPDLVNKFLRGAESSGSTDGADSQSLTLQEINLPAHAHTLKDEDISITGGSHNHNLQDENISITGGSHDHNLKNEDISITGGSHSHSFKNENITTSENTHNHGYYDSQGASRGNLNGKNAGSTWTVTGDNTHSHTVNLNGKSTNDNTSHSHTLNLNGKSTDNATHTHTLNLNGKSTVYSTTHTHTLNLHDKSTNATGSGMAFTIDTVPAYYTVIYIIKMA